MNVKVISRRTFKRSNSEKLIPLLRKLREQAEMAKGFVSRKTYSKLDDPDHFIIISEWQTADDWSNWMYQPEVREIQWQIDSLIGEKTFFDIYRPEDF